MLGSKISEAEHVGRCKCIYVTIYVIYIDILCNV